MKTKISGHISHIVFMMKLGDKGEYHLEQSSLLDILQNVWGCGANNVSIHHNDRAKLFAIFISLEEHGHIYKFLLIGVIQRSD